MASILKSGQDYAKKTLKEEWKKEKKSWKSSKSKKQPLGDKDDPVDGIVRVAASFVGTVSEAYQYRKEKKLSAKEKDAAAASAAAAAADERDASRSIAEDAENGEVVQKKEVFLTPQEEALGQPSLSSSPQPHELGSAAGHTDFSEAAWALDEARRVSEVAPPKEADSEYQGSGDAAADGEQENKDKDKDKDKDTSNFAEAFVKRHPFDPATAGTRSPIEVPIVIPQRRPKNRGRGFVRAYSPVLADAGIDQPEFLDFMDSFNRAIQPSEWVQAIELISWAGYAAPEPIAILLDQAAEAATEAAIEAQSRYRGGRFIDKVNADYFLPRGLVALIVTWKSWDGEEQEPPSAGFKDEHARTPEMESPAAKDLLQPGSPSVQKLPGGVSYEGPEITSQTTLDPEMSFAQGWRDIKSRKATPKEVHARLAPHMQKRMKRYNGVFECPETAPLVFPSAEDDYEVMVTKKNGKRMNGFDRGEQWLNGFRDRRAQMKWVAKTHDSTTSTTRQHEFRSRYADPSHPAASGDIVAFATGGKWSTRGRVKPGQQVVRQGELVDDAKHDEGEYSSGDEERDRKWAAKKEKMDRKRREKMKKRADKEKKGTSALSNLLRTDVLYLVVMNVPEGSAEKAAEATALKQDHQGTQEAYGEPSSSIQQQTSGVEERSSVTMYSHNWADSHYNEDQYDAGILLVEDRDGAHRDEPAPSYEAVRQQDMQAQRPRYDGQHIAFRGGPSAAVCEDSRTGAAART